MKKIATLTLTSVLLSSLTFSTAFAFSDVEEGQATMIDALQKRGVVSGVDSQHFAPKVKISYAQSVQMLVKALDLNLDAIRFKGQPTASGIYTNIADNAWYADAFVIAYYSGLEIPKDVNPSATITREQFGDLLVRALEKKGNFPMKKIVPATIADENQITPDYEGALQRLLNYKIATLDKNGKFNPKGELTRGDAAVWVYNAVRVLESHAQTPAPAPVEEISVNVEKVNDDVNKVTLSRGEKPSAGYSIEISGIRFNANGQAVVTYTLIDPQPDSMNVSMITEAKAVTYVSSTYKVVAEQAALSTPVGSAEIGKQLKDLVELAKQGKVPGITYAAHTGNIDDVKEVWGQADRQDSQGKGFVHATYSEKNVVIGFNKGGQIFDVQSRNPNFQAWTLAQIEQTLGKADDAKVNQDNTTYSYNINDQFQLKFVISKPTGNVDYISVFSPQDAVNYMAE